MHEHKHQSVAPTLFIRQAEEEEWFSVVNDGGNNNNIGMCVCDAYGQNFINSCNSTKWKRSNFGCHPKKQARRKERKKGRRTHTMQLKFDYKSLLYRLFLLKFASRFVFLFRHDCIINFSIPTPLNVFPFWCTPKWSSGASRKRAGHNRTKRIHHSTHVNLPKWNFLVLKWRDELQIQNKLIHFISLLHPSHRHKELL